MSTSLDRPLLGGHVSAAGGLYKAVENAQRIGAECFQMFGASPRQWDTKMHSEDSIERYKADLKKSGIGAVFLHAAYLINLAAADRSMWKKSVTCLAGHLRIAESIGAAGVIFHLGSNSNYEEGIANMIEGTQEVLKMVPGKSFLVMENSSGGGQKLGSAPKDIGALFKGVNSDRVKVCIDTAHAFESGLIDEYSAKKIKAFFNELDEGVGLKNVVALHVNDSKTKAYSNADRHENLGEGFIGLEGFKNLAKEKRLQHAAWMLEVPGFDAEGPDKKNVDILKSCF